MDQAPKQSDPESNETDPFQLQRFLEAQQRDYARALNEIREGEKRTCWMWYIFPQLDGLAFSPTSRFYAIKNLAEASAYLAHPVLGPRLRDCTRAALEVNGKTALEIFGDPDDLKLKSCATLFEQVEPKGSVFSQLLEKYYAGERDPRTLELLRSM